MSISLNKGETIRLSKESDGRLNRVILGLGWDVAAPKKGLMRFLGVQETIDLDASCILFASDGTMQEAVWFEQLQSRDGSIRHTGDNVTGAGEGDDEQILVELNRVPSHITALMFVVNSFGGQTFDRVANAHCRLLDANNNREVARYQLDSQGAHTALIMAQLLRSGAEWKMHAIGEPGRGKTFHDLVPSLIKHIKTGK
ncbi:MAG: TerD family protein [Magnetococcales bacterium]|nr:TerD family protein [Magnetococcales bacterium]